MIYVFLGVRVKLYLFISLLTDMYLTTLISYFLRVTTTGLTEECKVL